MVHRIPISNYSVWFIYTSILALEFVPISPTFRIVFPIQRKKPCFCFHSFFSAKIWILDNTNKWISILEKKRKKKWLLIRNEKLPIITSNRTHVPFFLRLWFLFVQRWICMKAHKEEIFQLHGCKKLSLGVATESLVFPHQRFPMLRILRISKIPPRCN